MSERIEAPISSQPKRSNRTLALLLIGAGIVIFLYSSGLLSSTMWNVIWPLALVGLGVDLVTEGRQRSKILAGVLVAIIVCIPIVGVTRLFNNGWASFGWRGTVLTLDGVDRLRTTIALTSGDVSIDDFWGTGNQVVELEKSAEITKQSKDGSTGVLEVGSNGWFRQDVEVQFARNLPLDVTIDIAAGDAKTLDFKDLKLERLKLTVHGNVEVKLPKQGVMDLDISSTAGEVKLEIPKNLPVRIEVDSNLSELDLDNRFQRDGDAYVTANYDENAPNRATIRIHATGGKVEVQ